MMSNSDARKRAADRTRPEPRGVDVAEGRSLWDKAQGTAAPGQHPADDYALFVWLGDNLAALLDAAEERDLFERLIVAARGDRDRALARESALRSRVEGLAVEWRYKGEFGHGAWQEGHGPDLEGQVLDECAAKLRALLSPEDQS